METKINNQSIVQRASQVLMNTYGRLPIALARGEGCWVWDYDGNKYLDLVAGIAVNVLGHSHPRLTQVISDQANKIIHTSNIYHILPQVELAERLTQISFADRVFFCNSGAEANEGAVKLTRKYFKKKNQAHRYQVICMSNAFHGRTLAMINATGQEKYLKSFLPPVEGFLHVPYGDLKALEEKMDDSVAAVMLEVVQGEGGVVLASNDFLKQVRKLCDQKGALLIFDEVQTGVGRTGTYFAYEHSQVIPDIMTLAKGLAGGIPIGALLAKESVSVFEPGDHAATFGGNPFCTRVALEVLQILKEGVLDHSQKVGEYFFNELKKLAQTSSIIQEVRGQGLMLGIELKVPGKDYVTQALSKGLLINCTHENVIRLVPPLILSQSEVDFAMKVLAEVLK
ncbi:MAG: acetylornithine transaminase [Deltaproteobacteria bacterium]|nr:acetylornithine transaminase [Deltaproteobacteria bacterium]